MGSRLLPCWSSRSSRPRPRWRPCRQRRGALRRRGYRLWRRARGLAPARAILGSARTQPGTQGEAPSAQALARGFDGGCGRWPCL